MEQAMSGHQKLWACFWLALAFAVTGSSIGNGLSGMQINNTHNDGCRE
jgi:hypothetical protein